MSSTMMQVDAKAALEDTLKTELKRHNASLAPGCEGNLRNLLLNAAGAVGNDVDRLEEAQANLVKLVAAMAEEAQLQGESVLHEWSLGKALGKLCPLFPFC